MPRTATTDRLPVACFAPPLTDDKLARYGQIIESLPDSRGEIRDAMRECHKACLLWWELPESRRTDVERFSIRHRGKDVQFAVTPLEKEHVKALWDAVPWPYELDSMSALFDRTFEGATDPGEVALRDAAYHLLWFAKELCNDREPLTQDKLPG